MSGGRPPRAGRPAPRSSAARGSAVVLGQRRMRPPLPSSAVEEVDLGEIVNGVGGRSRHWQCEQANDARRFGQRRRLVGRCPAPLDAAPCSRAAQATLAGCVVSVCSDANDRKTRETQASSGKNIYSH
jgi:hypothetical protein